MCPHNRVRAVQVFPEGAPDSLLTTSPSLLGSSTFRVPGRLPSLRQCHLQSGQAANPIPTDGDLVPDPPFSVRGGTSVSNMGPSWGWVGAALASNYQECVCFQVCAVP